MLPRIETLSEKKLVGMKKQMAFANNKTIELWKIFMPRLNEIRNSIRTKLFSAEVYGTPLFFQNFNPSSEFEKWAAVEVTELGIVPDEMETLILPAGIYAVFIHKGPASEGQKTYEHIFNNWLPNSDFTLDNRPHFALMGEKYKNDDPNSEEEIWIPVKTKDGYHS
ncbi:MAG: GyrI-like domain-containing protein [Ignavibacteriales bacterium]|nr:GyrI-like domain-containing protein [Ignavibacteriales bacterium]